MKDTPPGIRIIPLEYPGKGNRQNEPPLDNMNAIVKDLLPRIKWRLTRPYAFYGHSMGAITSYLLIKRILEEDLPPPEHLFVSGAAGPSVPHRHPDVSHLPKEEFFQSIKQMGGSPVEMFEDKLLLDFLEPVLRPDFHAIEHYEYEKTDPFDIPISVFIGKEEDILIQEAMKWNEETTNTADIHFLDGNHFFIFEKGPQMMKTIYSNLITTKHGKPKLS
jgi:surfactin synthase thioesterase subunit